jgi:hypothetical protein
LVGVAVVVLVFATFSPRLSLPTFELDDRGAISARSVSDATAVAMDRPGPRSSAATATGPAAPHVGSAGLAAWFGFAAIALVLMPNRPRSLVRVLARPRRGPPGATAVR